jgi:hypothetical protein
MNTFQQAAAHADIHTPLLVIAGAGSGKVIHCALFYVVFPRVTQNVTSLAVILFFNNTPKKNPCLKDHDHGPSRGPHLENQWMQAERSSCHYFH